MKDIRSKIWVFLLGIVCSVLYYFFIVSFESFFRFGFAEGTTTTLSAQVIRKILHVII